MSLHDPIVLSVDGHGGDQEETVTVPACLRALEADSNLSIRLTGQPERLQAALGQQSPADHLCERLEIIAASTVIPMDAKPVAVLRRGQDSSMWRAFEEVAEGRAQACVSGGATSAMMALGVKLLGLLPGIKRPALMAHVPSAHGYVALLDLGANLNVDASQLVQFAVMGSVAFDGARDGSENDQNPAIGLLNVGREDSKGHVVVKAAHQMLQGLPLNYIGFVEGDDLFSGHVDVAVCDGFAGNLLLKSGEGLVRMLFSELSRSLKSSLSSRLGAVLSRQAFTELVARFDPAAHNGAPLLGLNRVAVKSHGGANCREMTVAIMEASREARRRIPEKIGSLILEHRLEAEE